MCVCVSVCRLSWGGGGALSCGGLSCVCVCRLSCVCEGGAKLWVGVGWGAKLCVCGGGGGEEEGVFELDIRPNITVTAAEWA